MFFFPMQHWDTQVQEQEQRYGLNSAVQLKAMQHVASVKRKLLGEHRLLVVNFRLFDVPKILRYPVRNNRGWTC